MNDFSFSIPSPCHEDWNKMSENEKGRFCSSCSKTVMDFSTSSNEEIKKYFIENAGSKICGRLRSDQLAKPLRINIPLQIFRNQLSFLQCFLISLLLTFGSVLFSIQVAGQERMIGEVQLTKSDSDTISVSEIADTFQTNKIDDIEENEWCDTYEINPDSIPSDFEPIITWSPFYPDTNLIQTTIVLEDIDYIYGGMVCGPPETSPFDTTENHTSDEIIMPTPEFISEIFPNPAHDFTNLRIRTEGNTIVEVVLIDMTGKVIRVLLNQAKVSEGESNFSLDLNGIPPSQYLIQIRYNEAVETKRITITS